MTEIRPQKEFPFLDVYKHRFDVTERTIFAYDDNIYSDFPLTRDLIIHEATHHRQQADVGLDKWVELYLSDDKFRLDQEVEAYRNQLRSMNRKERRSSIKDCAYYLSSKLYGNIINYNEALALLK